MLLEKTTYTAYAIAEPAPVVTLAEAETPAHPRRLAAQLTECPSCQAGIETRLTENPDVDPDAAHLDVWLHCQPCVAEYSEWADSSNALPTGAELDEWADAAYAEYAELEFGRLAIESDADDAEIERILS